MPKAKLKPADYLFWAVKQNTGNSLRNLILIYLADHYGERGCFPSYNSIAERAGCSRRSVIHHVNLLESGGFLEKQKRATNGMSNSNMYHLKLETAGVQDVHHGVQEIHHGSAGDSLGVVQELHPETPSKKHPVKHPVKQTLIPPNNFDLFYSAYPKKTGRQPAQKAWAKLNPAPALINRILKDLQDRVSLGHWDTAQKQYIPAPAVYINQHRWDDEIIPSADFKPTPEQLYEKTQSMILEMDRDDAWLK